MISFEGIPKNQAFGVHCHTRGRAEILIEYVELTYPHKKNTHIDLLANWDHYKEDTIYYPHLDDFHKMNYGCVGGPASLKRKIYEFDDLVVIKELPIEQSDMDISSMLGL